MTVQAGPVARVGRGAAAFEHQRLPEHCVRRQRRTPALLALERLLRREGLHSVCQEARCPNRSECWERGHVTFMLLGSVCTRACRFCAVATGLPARPPDPEEPGRVAAAAARLGLSHVVLTSVDRDDLPDGGAGQFAATLRAIRALRPRATTEVLTPDFQGDREAVAAVCEGAPDVYNHNVETVPRLYRRVRPGARYERSLAVLAEARRLRPEAVVKSGLMLGLGETRQEVLGVLGDLRSAGVDTLTVGQYLRPSRRQLPVERYWEPAEFETLAGEAAGLGFAHGAAGPLVRSSYNADESLEQARRRAGDA